MQYSQLRAMWAISKASLRSILRSPSAVVFSFAFPFIFILVFGFIGNGGGKTIYRVVLAKDSDTSNALYTALVANSSIRFVNYPDSTEELLDMRKGKIAGEIFIKKMPENSGAPYDVTLSSYTSSGNLWPQLKILLDNTINEVSNNLFPNRQAYASFNFNFEKDIKQIRAYKTIDFILPGQLGFSLLSAGVFGVAFMFFNLRNQLVLKRFFATPIKRPYIILGESFSRVIFQMMTAIVIIGAGYLFFGFTLVHGWFTFIQMLFLSFIGLILFMGFGFIISGIATSDSTIPPLANIITLPQFLLGGTFFSIEVFPNWLQPIAKAMPLTHLNNAMRSVAFEGHNLWDVKLEIGILLLWTVAVYFVATKVFKWE